MIRLGTNVEFAFVASAGALGWAGHDEGHGIARLWKMLFRITGKLDTRAFAFFTKTLTLSPRRGNLRLFAPWRAVRYLGNGSFVNSVGLTNPGVEAWCHRHGPLVADRFRHGQKTFVSVAANTVGEIGKIVRLLVHNCGRYLHGIEIDLSCANWGSGLLIGDDLAAFSGQLLREAIRHTWHPIGLKFGATQDCFSALRACDGVASWFHLVNAVPWMDIYPNKQSPLSGYGYGGAVSGPAIRELSMKILKDAVARPFSDRERKKTPIISGGGVSTKEDVIERFAAGADAVAFGSLFLSKPWKPNEIVQHFRSVS